MSSQGFGERAAAPAGGCAAPDAGHAAQGVRGTGRLAGALVAALYVLVYIAPLGIRPLLAPDELRNAEVSREMRVSGDWVVPRLNGVRYFEKPALGYWAVAGSTGALGQNAFAVRLPFALAAGAAALLLFRLVQQLTGQRRDALLAAAVYLTSALVYGIGVFAVLDSLLALWITGAMACFWWAYTAPSARGRHLQLALAGVCAGLGFLTKGFVALALPIAAIGCFLLWERRAADLLRLGAAPLAAALAVALPWALAIHAREGDFWRYFVVVEHIQRSALAEAQHDRPFWFLWPYAIGGVFPWILLCAAAARGLRRRELGSFGRFAACWFAGPLLLLSLSRGKIGTYALPCLPPLCIALAVGLAAPVRAARDALLLRLGALVCAVVCAAGLALVWIAHTWVPVEGLQQVLSALDWRLLCIGLGCWFAGAAASALARSRSRALWLFAAAPLPALLLAPWIVLRDGSDRQPLSFIERHKPEMGSDPLIVSDPRCLYAANLAFARADLLMFRTGELEYGLRYTDSRRRLVRASQLREMALDPRRARDLSLVLELDRYESMLEDMPPADFEVRSRDFILAVYRARAAG